MSTGHKISKNDYFINVAHDKTVLCDSYVVNFIHDATSELFLKV